MSDRVGEGGRTFFPHLKTRDKVYEKRSNVGRGLLVGICVCVCVCVCVKYMCVCVYEEQGEVHSS